MTYKRKFHLLIMIAVLYNLFQLISDQKSIEKIDDPDMKKTEIHCQILGTGLLQKIFSKIKSFPFSFTLTTDERTTF